MNVVNKFNFTLDKERTLRAVHSYFSWPDLNRISYIYDELVSLLHNSVKPIGVYSIEPNLNELQYKSLTKCNYTIYCLITIGVEPTLITDTFFNTNEFEKAVVLDAMSTEYLFDISSQMFEDIYNTVKNTDMGLTYKIAPGDGEIDINFQKTIVKKLYNPNIHDIKIVDGLMLYPPKSMSYIWIRFKCTFE